LQELLDHAGRPLHHLARGDLVDDRRRQPADDPHLDVAPTPLGLNVHYTIGSFVQYRETWRSGSGVGSVGDPRDRSDDPWLGLMMDVPAYPTHSAQCPIGFVWSLIYAPAYRAPAGFRTGGWRSGHRRGHGRSSPVRGPGRATRNRRRDYRGAARRLFPI